MFAHFLSGKEGLLRESLGQNTFNVGKKRLQDGLLEYLGNQVFENEVNEEVSAIKLLVLARHLFSHGHMKIAQKTLDKSEAKALKLNHFGLLNEIYHTAIHYSYLLESKAQLELFDKAQENNEKHTHTFRLNLAHAQLRSAFEASEFTDNRSKVPISQTIEAIYAQFDLPQTTIDNFQTLYQLAQIADVAAFQQKDYSLVDLYFVDRIEALSGSTVDAERTLIYHIDVLFLVAHIYFRQRNFLKSMEYLDKMKVQMQRNKGKYMKARLVQWTTLRSLNLNFLGKWTQAVDLLESLFDANNYPFEALLNPWLTRAMLHFQQGELRQAQTILSRFQHKDHWYQQRVGQDWLLNRRYIEILLHIELGNVDFVESRINSLTRKYADLFETEPYQSIRPFLKLIRSYLNAPDLVASVEFAKTVEKTIPWKSHEAEDIYLMCFYAWLKAKMTQKELYSTTLELVGF